MRTNWVREKLRAGQATVGCFVGLGSPNVAELLARAGFDWLGIETEHNGLDSAEIEHMLMALNGTRTVPIFRTPSSRPRSRACSRSAARLASRVAWATAHPRYCAPGGIAAAPF